VELTAEEVEKGFVEVESDFLKHVSLPGFRKGKAPKELVKKSLASDIVSETKRLLVSENYRAAIKEHNLKVYNLLNVEEPALERGKPSSLVVEIEVAPQFELPAYRGVVAKREIRSVTEADIDQAIDLLRARMGSFEKVSREAQDGDIVVASYTGTCEGKPISELAPAARGLAAQQNFWIEIKDGSFLPGFAEQLRGAAAGTKRTVQVDFPADFPTEPLAGKKGVYEVEVVEIKEKKLPPLDDAFAKSWEAADMASLREGVRGDLQNELNDKINRSVREQVVRTLIGSLDFEMPESAILGETRNMVYEIVRDNQQRGMSKEIIDKNKDQIFNVANSAAKERVKAAFVFARIAEKEGIKVTGEEYDARIFSMARSMKMPHEKLVKEIEKRDGRQQIVEQILNEKVIDFLQQHARIEDVPAAPAPAPQA